MTDHHCYWMRRGEGRYECRCGAKLSIGAAFGKVIDGEIFVC